MGVVEVQCTWLHEGQVEQGCGDEGLMCGVGERAQRNTVGDFKNRSLVCTTHMQRSMCFTGVMF